MAIKKKTRTVYVCSDGEEFTRKKEAESHEKSIERDMKLIKADKFLFDLLEIELSGGAKTAKNWEEFYSAAEPEC